MRHAGRVLLLMLMMVTLALGARSGQSATNTAPKGEPANSDPQFEQRRNASQDDDFARMQKDQQKKLNKDRHASLKKDTDKLLELATELKMEVDKSNENTLSLDVIRKADQIEKLAHSVKEKMKGM